MPVSCAQNTVSWSENKTGCAIDLFTNDVILAFDDALRWNKCRMDIEIELTKGIFFLEVVFPSTKAHFDLNSPLIRSKKKFWCFYWLMSCALARWFQKCIHVHSKYCSKLVKNVKNLRESTILGKLQVPGGFSHFWPTCNNICYGHVYIFGISAPRRCWWANKNAKKLNFFFRPPWGWVQIGKCRFWSAKIDF